MKAILKAFWPFQVRPFPWKGYLYYITLNPVRTPFTPLDFDMFSY